MRLAGAGAAKRVVRPRSPDQWQQAYLQSQLYVAYLTKTHGEPAIGKLLQAYADGLDTDAALPKAIFVLSPAMAPAMRWKNSVIR